MMTTIEIKEKLHHYIDTAEEKKLAAIYTLLEDELDETILLTDEQKAELDKRYYEHMNGIGRTYTWDETVAFAKQKLAERRNR